MNDPSGGGATRPPAKAFVPALVVGWSIVAYGASTALEDRADAHPVALVVHVVAFGIVHDALVAPLAFTVGWLAGRLLPPPARGPVRAALAATALVVVFALPLVGGWGRRPTNPSTLPLDYGRNVVLVVLAVWAVAGAVVLRRVLRGDPAAPTVPPGPGPHGTST